jgi:hypothetical protein
MALVCVFLVLDERRKARYIVGDMKNAVGAAAAVILLWGACAVRQDISLQAGGAGTARLEVELHPVFMAYYKDLASGFSSSFDPAHPRFFNEEAIRAGFLRNAELELVSFKAEESGRLSLDFRVKDITGAIKNENRAAGDIISRAVAGGRQTLAIRLDRENLASLLKVIPEMDTPFAKMLLPPEGARISEEEYREHLAWALEDYAADANIEEILRNSLIHLLVRTPGKILSQTGGRLKSGREVVFEIPVLRLFTLEKRLEFSVTY